MQTFDLSFGLNGENHTFALEFSDVNFQKQAKMANIGKITQVIGPVVDVAFDSEGSTLPNILDSLEVTKGDGTKVVLECQ